MADGRGGRDMSFEGGLAPSSTLGRSNSRDLPLAGLELVPPLAITGESDRQRLPPMAGASSQAIGRSGERPSSFCASQRETRSPCSGSKQYGPTRLRRKPSVGATPLEGIRRISRVMALVWGR